MNGPAGLAVLLLLSLVAVAWIVYPRAMIFLARRVAMHEDPGTPSPATVTVILATRDSPGAVADRLAELASQAHPGGGLETVVAVDAAWGDALPEPLRSTPGTRFVTVDLPGGKAMALNAAVGAASGEILVFTDTAQRFRPGTVAALVRALVRGPHRIVSGSLELAKTSPANSPIHSYWNRERALRQAEAAVHSSIGVTGAVYAMYRADWAPLPAGLILDDVWVPMRLVLRGHRVGFEPNAIADDSRPPARDQEFRRKVRTQTGLIQLVAWMPALLAPWRNPVWVQFACHKLLRLVSPLLLLVAGAIVLWHLVRAAPAAGWAMVMGSVLLSFWARTPGGEASRAGRLVSWGLAMQGALLLASWNGVRGKWDVWRP